MKEALRIAAHIIRADAKVGNLKPLHAMDVQSFIQDPVLYNAVPLLRGH